LQSIICNKETSKSIITRCQILLELDSNNPNLLTQLQTAKTFGVCNATTSNIVKDYVGHGIDYAITYQRNPNSYAKRKVDKRFEAHIIELACASSRWMAIPVGL